MPQAAPRVLIIDDSAPTAKALAKILSNAAYETSISHSGGDAIERAATAGPFAAAVVDIHLGDMNGLVVAQRLRQILGEDATIIVLSGDTSLETLNSLPHVGVTYFFSKPVNSAHLVKRLHEWVPVQVRNGAA